MSSSVAQIKVFFPQKFFFLLWSFITKTYKQFLVKFIVKFVFFKTRSSDCGYMMVIYGYMFLLRLQTYKLNFLRKWRGFLTVSIPSANVDLTANNWFFLKSTNATSVLQNQEKPMRASSSWPRNRLVMFINFSFFSPRLQMGVCM